METGEKRKREEQEQELEHVAKKKKTENFKDEEFFMSLTKDEDYSEKGYSLNAGFGKRADDLTMDLNPDDKDNMQKRKQQSLKWDRKKKKYIRESGAKTDIFGKTLKQRNESGQLIDPTKKANMYKDWQRKSKQTIQKVGEEEKVSGDVSSVKLSDMRNAPKFRHNSQPVNANVKDEIKTKDKIAKERKAKENNKKRNQKRRGPNNHPGKTRKLNSKVHPNARVKVKFSY